MKHRILFIVLTLCLVFSVAESRPITRYKSMTASVADTFKCSEKVTLTVTSTDESVFKGDKIDFQRLVGSARAMLGFECDRIKSIRIYGNLGEKLVYQGISSATSNWVIVDTTPQKVETAKKESQPSENKNIPSTSKSVGKCIKGDCTKGSGTFIYPDGTEYVGQFKDGKRHGKGTLIQGEANKYVGGFKDDKKHGHGTFTIYAGGKSILLEYVGEYKDGKQHGNGTQILSDGTKWNGEFKDGNLNGQGTQILSDGTKWSGEFKDGKLNGQGTLSLPSGAKLVGEWKNGEMNGKGTKILPDGAKYIGNFKDGKLNGNVTTVLASGEKFAGQFENGEQIGEWKNYSSIEKDPDINLAKTQTELHRDTNAVINYLRPLARTQVPENVLTEVADLIARTIAAEPNISAQRRRTWIDTRSGKPVYELDQVGDSQWAGQVPRQVQEALKRAIFRIQYQDPIGLFAFNNPFSYNRSRHKLSKYYPKRFKNRKPANSGAITGEWVLDGAAGLFFVSRLNQGKAFSIEKHRHVLGKHQLLAASYSQDGGRTVSYHFFWFETAPPNWKTILKDLPTGQGLEKIGPPVAQAPDNITQANSMIFEYKADMAAPDNSGKKSVAEKLPLPQELENPDGLYRVSRKGVLEYRMTKKEANGSYRFNCYIITHKEETLRSSQLAAGGWWHPKYRQFYTEPYANFSKGHSCNRWMKEWGQWSTIIVPEVYTTGNGMTFQGYRSSEESSVERPTGTRTCMQVSVKGFNCNITCARWEWLDNLPDAYLLRNKDKALSLYNYLNIRGSKVTSRTEAVAAEKKANDIKEAKRREKEAYENKLKSLLPLLSQDNAPVRFPADLDISAKIHDFMLARFYPKKLSQEMLQAMMSSRWAYERSDNNPLGGNFFKPNSRTPNHDELKLLTHYFKPWLLKRANALPQILIIDISLDYSQSVMQAKNNCIQLTKHNGSASGIEPYLVEEAEKKIRECEKRNKRTMAWSNLCQQLQEDLKKAKATLTQAQADGCQKIISSTATSNNGSSCADSSTLTLANFKDEMMNCISQTCGTPQTGSDTQAYQECVTAVSSQFRDKLTQLMGGAKPRPVEQQPSTQRVDACEDASKKITRIKTDLKNSYCNSVPNDPAVTDCRAGNTLNVPDVMEVGRINLESMLTCSEDGHIFNHTYNQSAQLLPRKRPLYSSHFLLMLYLDKLNLPYEFPPGIPKNGNSMVNARIRLEITGTDPRSFRRHQLGLKAMVKGVEYTQKF